MSISRFSRALYIFTMLVSFIFCSFASAEVVEPVGVAGDTYYTSGTAETSTGCGWDEVHARDGSDGGQLTIELDGCQVPSYEIFYRAQNAGAGYIADLELDDLIIVWDEDADHGEMEQFKNFNFSGTYVAYPDCDYIQITTTDSRTNWAIYRVEESGSLYKGSQPGVGNEHEAIRLELQRNLLDFTKTYYVNGDPNDVGCAGPGDKITFEICWNNTSGTIFEDPNIIDYLPPEVDYNYLISIFPELVEDPNYNQEDRTYTWQIDTIFPNDSGCVELTVTVNNKAEPGMNIHNIAEMWTYDPSTLIARATEDTPVCCWDVDDPNVIYVDITARGYDTGTSWSDAYSGEDGLQKALTRASESTCDVGLYTIYVTAGTYNPGDDASSTFVIPEGAKVYGGFMTGGSDISERNPDIYETLLTGHRFIDTDPNSVYHYHIYNDTVVTMADQYVSDPNFPVDETTILDGFTITDAVEYGVYGTDVDFDIFNCTVADSGLFDGIYGKNGDVAIKWCEIKNSGLHGVEHEGAGNTLTIENSQVVNNKQYGIFSVSSTPTIKNCVIFGNGHSDSDFEGVRIILPTEVPVLYNNTIVYNALEGVYWYDDANSAGDPNYPDYPDMQNCIVYYNNSNGSQVSGFDEDTYASYCDIQGCTEVNNNINDAPDFMLAFDSSDTEAVVNPYHYHLAYDSDCKEAGNPNHDTSNAGLYDIDGEDRIADTSVDIGADEINSCDVGNSGDLFHELDWNLDGIIDSYEVGMFAEAWLVHDPNEPGYTLSDQTAEDAAWMAARNYNFNGGYYIDYGDFAVFAQDWLWRTCWKVVPAQTAQSSQQSMMMPMAMGTMSFEIAPEPATEELYSMADGIHSIIEHVDTSLDEGHENADNLYDMKIFLEDILVEMQADYEKYRDR